MAKQSYCDGIKDCEDGSDEPDTCIVTKALNAIDFKRFYDISDPKNTLGPVFGGITGVMLLFFTILILVVVVITVCICNKHCPIYKWRKRREQPPVGVIIAPGEHLIKEQEESAYNIGINNNILIFVPSWYINVVFVIDELETADTTADCSTLITP